MDPHDCAAEDHLQQLIDRRSFLQRTGLFGLAMLGANIILLPGCEEPKKELGRESLPTPPANPGEAIPEMLIRYNTDTAYMSDMLRKFVADWEKIGLKFKLIPVSNAEWLKSVLDRTHGDIQIHTGPIRPERIDPTEWLVSRAHGTEAEVSKRNFGNYRSKDYDKWVDLQLKESDPKKRKEYVLKAQETLVRDWHICAIGYNSILQAYNSSDWENVMSVPTNGVAQLLHPWTVMNIKPKGSRKRLVIGNTSVLESTNVVAASGNMRIVGRMMYDTFTKLNEKLEIIPWAAESWKNVGEKEWEVKLRPGMKWTDGNPVTVDDVKYTFDMLFEFKPGMLSLVWEPLAGVEIANKEQGTLRFTTKEQYGQFDTILLMLQFILPKHHWPRLMDEQGVTDPQKIVIRKPEDVVGSGQWKWVHYKKDEEVLLAVNKAHFNPIKHLEELLLVGVPTVDGLLGRLGNKEVDMIMPSLRPSQTDTLKQYSHVSTIREKDLSFLIMVPFTERMPWRDIEFRKAWHYSMDKNFLVNVLWEGVGEVAKTDTFLPPAGPWFNPNLPSHPYDLDQAKKILAEAGYSWDAEGRLRYPAVGDDRFKKRIRQVTAVDGEWWGPGPDEVGAPPGRA